MNYGFDEIKRFYLRQYKVELNDIIIDTNFEFYLEFEKKLNKNPNYQKIKAYKSIITFLETKDLTIDCCKEYLNNLEQETKTKKISYQIVWIKKLIEGKTPKLFKSYNTKSKISYLKNTIRYLNSYFKNFDAKKLQVYGFSVDEFNEAMKKIKLDSKINKIESNIFTKLDTSQEHTAPNTNKTNFKTETIDIKTLIDNINSKNDKVNYHYALYETKNNKYLSIDEVINGSGGRYLKYFFKALTCTFENYIFAKILQNRNEKLNSKDISKKQLDFSLRQDIYLSYEKLLALKQVNKSKSIFSIVSLYHYLGLSKYEAYDFSSYYLSLGSCRMVKKEINFTELKNTIDDILIYLFPNYIYLNYGSIFSFSTSLSKNALTDFLCFKIFITLILFPIFLQIIQNFNHTSLHNRLYCFSFFVPRS